VKNARADVEAPESSRPEFETVAKPRRGTVAWVAVVVAIASVYAPVLRELGHDWIRDPNYSHGVLIPFISAYLIWRQRHTLAELPRRPATAGLWGILAGAGLLVLGTAAAEVFTQRVSFLVLIASTVLFLLGWRWLRALAFPIALVFLAIPLPYVLYYSLTSPLQAFAARCAVLGLKSVGVPVVAQGNVLHLPDTSLEVAEACSGIRSLYAFLALGALLAYSMAIPALGRVLVFLATIPLSVLANAFRVWTTSLGAYFIGPQVAQGLVHELFGVIIFVSAFGLFILIRKGARTLWESGR
jgi:exosortase